MNVNLTLKKLKYGERPLISFAYCFSTGETYLPDYSDVYNKEGDFERITNSPETLIPSLTHEFLHEWLSENFDKNISLLWDNIDKNNVETDYCYSNLSNNTYKGRTH